MQTFVPLDDPECIAFALDNVRLNKQRVEAFQVLRAITDDTYGWQNHPAVNMWRGHVGALASYGLAMCAEWRNRDGADNTDLFGRISEFTGDVEWPRWWGDDRVHESHRSNLMRKDSDWYCQFWSCPNDLPYVWPTKLECYAVL